MERKYYCLLVLLVLFISGCNDSTPVLNQTTNQTTKPLIYDSRPCIETIDQFDEANELSIKQYLQGLGHLKYNEREVPLNHEDRLRVVNDLILMKADMQEDDFCPILIEAKINLMKAEDVYKISQASQKGRVDDGFRCDEKPYILNSSDLLDEAGDYGLEAAEILWQIVLEFDEEKEYFDLSKPNVEYMNETFAGLHRMADAQREAMDKYCSEENNETISES
jgi:hypothetical protein